MKARCPTNRVCCLLVAVCLVALLGGCETISMKRFASATRIDTRLNPGLTEYPPLFESQMKRVRERRRMTCSDEEVIAGISERLALHEEKWENWWAYPPPPPPAVLELYHGTQWLGSLDLYDWALGHEHNKIHRLEEEEAADILRLLCDCTFQAGIAKEPESSRPAR